MRASSRKRQRARAQAKSEGKAPHTLPDAPFRPLPLTAVLSRSTRLTHLLLPAGVLEEPEGLHFVSGLTHLTSLKLDGYTSVAGMTAALAPLTNLTRLSCGLDHDGPLSGAVSLQLPPRLRDLELRNEVRPDFLQQLTGLSRLCFGEHYPTRIAEQQHPPRRWSLPPLLKVYCMGPAA